MVFKKLNNPDFEVVKGEKKFFYSFQKILPSLDSQKNVIIFLCKIKDN